MIYLHELQKETDTKYLVGGMHYMPFDPIHGLNKTQQELEQSGILIESLPAVNELEGQYAILCCNPSTGVAWYEYAPIPPREQTIDEKVALMQAAIDDIILGGVL